MDFFETVEKRASYRSSFVDREVPESDIRKIITAGLHAPSGYNFQTTSYVVIRDPEMKEKLA
ncbi:MAG: nitroreductase family protein, partial [Lachnospiraceae bacterium]|nr:nitroreductase family protein [Lachnospiraceae bacterium]